MVWSECAWVRKYAVAAGLRSRGAGQETLGMGTGPAIPEQHGGAAQPLCWRRRQQRRAAPGEAEAVHDKSGARHPFDRFNLAGHAAVGATGGIRGLLLPLRYACPAKAAAAGVNGAAVRRCP